ncbi:MAG: hypothetical protein IKO40_12625, partial [Kiritimatiellae bacterium]|nr:hypothetical protein [Kiritimatiellia bacterium]
ETAARLKAWGFNSLGAACDTVLLGAAMGAHAGSAALRFGQDFATDEPEHSIRPYGKAPFTALPNVFHPDWPTHCDAMAREKCAPERDDPTRIGYYIDNELAWWGKDLYRATGVYDTIAALPPEHSARRELERWMAASGGSGAQPPSLAVKLAFLRHFARTYFEVATAAIRRHDPNHLILGCRFAGLQGAHPVVWEECGRFCDIVSFNCYPWADLDRGVVLDEKCGVPMEERLREYHGYAGRPLFVSEWSFPALDTGHPCLKGAGQRVPTQVERAEATALFLRTMRSDPHVVGCDWFMWCDRPAQGSSKWNAEDCNYGLVNERGEPYETLIAALAPQCSQIAIDTNVHKSQLTESISERDRYWTEAAGHLDLSFVDNDEQLSFVNNSDGTWALSNASVRVRGRIGSRFMADEIAFGDTAVGCFGACLHLIDGGAPVWIDAKSVVSAVVSTNPATGIASATIRAEGGKLVTRRTSLVTDDVEGDKLVTRHSSLVTGDGEGDNVAFAITVRLSLAPSATTLLAEIVSVENTGRTPLDARQFLMRPWSLDENPEAVKKVLDCWGVPCEAEWRIAGGGSWGISSRDATAKRFRFFIDRKGLQHPDARFAAVDAVGQSAASPIGPGETWEPTSPMSARIFMRFPGGAE